MLDQPMRKWPTGTAEHQHSKQERATVTVACGMEAAVNVVVKVNSIRQSKLRARESKTETKAVFGVKAPKKRISSHRVAW